MSIAAARQAAMPFDAQTVIVGDVWGDGVRQRALARAANEPPRPPRRVVIWAIAIGVLAHVVLLLGLYWMMQPDVVEDHDVMQVELIAAPPSEPALPEPPAASRPAVREPVPAPMRSSLAASPDPGLVRRVPSPATSRPSAKISSVPTPSEPPSVHVYNADGSLDVPKDLAEQLDAQKPQPDFIPQSTAPSPIMEPRRPMKLRPNYFAKSWVHPRNETLLSAGLSKLNDLMQKATVSKDFDVGGEKVVCGWTLILGGCMWGFPPPPGGRPTEPWKPATVLDEQ